MIKATIELLLSQYFLFKSILGNYLSDGKGIFDYLSKIFMIPTTESDQLFSAIQNPIIQGFNTQEEYMRYMRIQHYLKEQGDDVKRDAYIREIAKIKGSAILSANENKYLLSNEVTLNLVLDCLSKNATIGKVQALKILGIMQCEGIIVDQNVFEGKKKLSKSAEWNDCVSILCLLYYNKDDDSCKSYYMSKLRQILIDSPLGELYNAAEAYYGVYRLSDTPEVKLLNKAFFSGVLKPDVIDSKYSRIVFSQILSLKDKEKTIFSADKIRISDVSDLPLRLSNNVQSYDLDLAFNRLAIQRQGEIQRIIASLKSSSLAKSAFYRPTCICSDSKYLLNSYADAIMSGVDANCEVIDVSQLNTNDVERTSNNVILRSINEDKSNIIMLYLFGRVEPYIFNQINKFLQTIERGKFHLHLPNVTLDLSSILPICFCDNANARQLKNYCDIIQLQSLSEQEFDSAVQDIISHKERQIGDIKICLDGEAHVVFGNTDVDRAEQFIDFAVCAHGNSSHELSISRRDLQALSHSNYTIGFKE
ncbi:MAG: hypothetical protein ACI4M5_05400 [Christensenellales bacterium]